MKTVNGFRKTIIKPLLCSASIFFTSMTLLSAPTAADDTDVFLGSNNNNASNIKPNVLFILDTSGSMDWASDTPGQSRLTVMKHALTQILTKTNDINIGLMTFNSRGGPVRYPVNYIDADVTEIDNGGFNIVNSIAQSSDDAEENINTLLDPGAVATNNPYLHVSESLDVSNPTVITVSIANDADDAEEDVFSGQLNPGNDTGDLDAEPSTDIGLRFVNVSVPQGATIVSAELLMTIDNDGSSASGEYQPASIRISAEASDSAAGFSGNGAISSRPRTNTAQLWDPVPAADRRQTITSPNLNLLIQEIVNRPGWSAGNNMAVFLETLNGFRDFETQEDSSSRAARLRISYAENPNRVRKLLGFRFQDIKIPQGAKINRAFLDFTAGSNSSDAVSYKIYGENAADSATFQDATFNISSRPKTASAVDWHLNAANAWESNKEYSTPDLAPVIQAIVDQGSWCGGNALSLLFEPTSSASRLIASFDETSGATSPPSLRIDFDTNTQNISAPNTGCMNTEITARVNRSSDDVEERTNNGTLTTGSGTLDLIRDGNRDQYIGLRFNDLQIPQGASIIESYVEFTSNDDTSTSTSLTIRGHRVSNSPEFSGRSAVSNRLSGAVTNASVSWNSIPDWDDNEVHRTPELKTIIEEIVGLSGWAPGNSLSLMISGSGTRRAESYDGDAARAPRLVVKLQQNLAGVPSVSGQTVRQKLIQEVNDLRTVANTPLVNTYMEAIRYFRGMPVFWGKQRGYQYSTYDRYSRLSHFSSHTGGALDRSTSCSELNLNASACVSEHIDNSPVYTTPMKDSCQVNYIVILSDGEQNEYSSSDGIAGLLATAPDPNFPSSCNTNNGGADCGLKLAEFAKTFDQNPNLDLIQSITTHSIGFSFTSEFLKNMAAKGGGLYKEANNADELVEAFETIIGDILSRPTTFTAPTLTVSAFNRLFNSNEIYISLFEPERSARWSGNIKKYFLCTPNQSGCTVGELMDANGVPAAADSQIKPTARSVWGDIDDGADVEVGGAGMQIPAYDSRLIYTYTGGTEPSNVNLAASQHRVAVNNSALTAEMLGVPADERDELVAWITGQDVDDEDANNVTTENRWAFGDPLHSAAVVVNYGLAGETVTSKLFVGTNDGGFRMINTENGAEEWMFIPQDMLAIQEGLRDNAAGANHIYGIDGSPVVWRHDVNGDNTITGSAGDFVRVYVGQRRGGNHYYALNVTPSSGVTNPNAVGQILPTLMWQINSSTAGYERMGQTWSKPYRTSVLVEQSGDIVQRNVLIFGGGYDTLNDVNYGPLGADPARLGNAIYIADAMTGQLIWSASGSAGAAVVVPEMNYSIPSDIQLLDMNGDGATDRLYVGDLGGQIWRVDLGVINSTSNRPVVGKFAELSNNAADTPAADHRSFMYRPQVVLVNDTDYSDADKAKYLAVAIISGNRAKPLDENVHDRLYVLRDFQVARMPDANNNGLADAGYAPIEYNDNELYDATSGVTNVVNLDALKSSTGWYIDLKENDGFVGEKGITEGLILLSSIETEPPIIAFNTYTPGQTASVSACSVGLGTNRTYFVNLLNGTGTDYFDEVSKSRSRLNEAFGIASELSASQLEGQLDQTIRDNPTSDDLINFNVGPLILPINMIGK